MRLLPITSGSDERRQLRLALGLVCSRVVAYTSIYMEPSEIARTIGAECLCFRSRRLARVLTRHFDDVLRPLEIQATQLTLLAGIAGPGPAGQSMPRLHDLLAMDPTTLSRNLKPLQNRGLVIVETAEKDKRARIAKLTAEGERVLGQALPLWRQAQDQLVKLLGEDQSVALRQQLELSVPLAVRRT